ncbi:response regulator [Haliea sp. E17]|uniref:response regulator n=1 Tax=Haliea sp. E17 TaxID=3401576 RepID=UPI003AAFBBA3
MSKEQTSQRPRVLVVDDDETILAKATQMLEQLGYETATASSGWDAVTRLDTTRPDLILLDITMQPLDGFKTLTLIRASKEGFADIPVAMLSSHDDVFNIGKARSLGCSAYLEKPLELQELKAVLRELLTVRAVG